MKSHIHIICVHIYRSQPTVFDVFLEEVQNTRNYLLAAAICVSLSLALSVHPDVMAASMTPDFPEWSM